MQTLRALSALGLSVLVSSGVVALALAQAERPRLVVVLTLDQMRADYVERYGHQWSGGLKRLVTEGARFTNAAYPYLNTVTCPGHTTISTGTFPRTHGMILNAWWDRATGRLVDCYTDASAAAVSYEATAPPAPGLSTAGLRAPAFSDELRAQSSVPPRVISVAVKARSAIALGGVKPDTVLWMDRGRLTTSTAFAPARQPWVEAFVRRHAASVAREDWSRLLPAERYLGVDADAAERPPTGWSTEFPHAVQKQPDAEAQRRLWAESPQVDEYLGDLLLEAIRAERLGTRNATDLLAMSFSSLDAVGHAFGPDSHEVQDALLRIDRTIGRLLDALDAQVGPGRYVVALSADHGVSPIPEQAQRSGLDAGRVDASGVLTALEQQLSQHFGEGRHVSRVTYTDAYLTPGTVEKLDADAAVWAAVRDALSQVPGVGQAYRRSELTGLASTDDPALRAARLSYFPGRSGDIVLVPRPYWILSSAGATHGSPHGYDARVPIVLFGPGIRPGRYWQSASPADIAPTLAALLGMTMARAEGRILSEAFDGVAR